MFTCISTHVRIVSPSCKGIDAAFQAAVNAVDEHAVIKDVLETNSSWPPRLARWWVSSRPSRHDAVSSDVES